MKKFEKIKNVSYVDSYTDAPLSARYILRETYEDFWVLEHYSKNSKNVLSQKVISECIFYPVDFHEALKKCRAIMHNNEILWVEKTYLCEGYVDELNIIYKDFILKPLTKEQEDALDEEYFWARMFPEDDGFGNSMFPEYDDEYDEHDEY